MVRRPLRSRLVRATASVAAAVFLASCGGSSGSSGSSGSDAASTASVATPTTSGSAATSGSPATAAAATPAILQFSAPLVSGGALDGTTFTGKPVAFWFWAPW